MEKIEARLQSLKNRRQEADRRRTLAEGKLDEVSARREQTLAALREQGFDSPEEAAAEVQRINAQVETILEEISEKVAGL